MFYKSVVTLSDKREKRNNRIIKDLQAWAERLYREDFESESDALDGIVHGMMECSRNETRCQHASCQYCLKAAHNSLKICMSRKIKEGQFDSPFLVTLVDTAWACKDLADFDFAKHKKEILKQIDCVSSRMKLKGVNVIGSLDISYNVRSSNSTWPADKLWEPHFQPHVHVLVWGFAKDSDVRAMLSPLLSHTLSPTGSCQFHIRKVQPLDVQKTLGYVLKNNFFQRTSFPNPHKQKPRKGKLLRKQRQAVWHWYAQQHVDNVTLAYNFTFGGFDETYHSINTKKYPKRK